MKFDFCVIFICCILASSPYVNGKEPLPTFAGPAMGTTYRVTLKSPIPNTSLGSIHRDIDQLLQEIDLSLSTWRADSVASRLNHAQAHTPIQLDRHLTAVFRIAEKLHRRTKGRFDITVAPLITWWQQQDVTHALRANNPLRLAAPPELLSLVGFSNLQLKKTNDSKYPYLQKKHAAVAIDLSGIGAGYAVDQIGEHLESLGSAAHLVELGGEVRAWGQPGPFHNWRVVLRDDRTNPPEIISLQHGQALAASTSVPGNWVVNPLTGTIALVSASAMPVVVYAPTCAEADGLATAKVLETVEHNTKD
ncbi:MAG: FAD:protein FMN transferase [Pirellulales bacterium]